MKTTDTTGFKSNPTAFETMKNWSNMSEDEKSIAAAEIREDNYYISDNSQNVALVAEQIEIGLTEDPEYYNFVTDDIEATARELAEIISGHSMSGHAYVDCTNRNLTCEAGTIDLTADDWTDKAANIKCGYDLINQVREALRNEESVTLTLVPATNPENDHSLCEQWLTPEEADSDEYIRELCVTTDNYYDWTSERARLINRVLADIDDGEIDVDRLARHEADWRETCTRYCDPMGWDYDNDASFSSIMKEIKRGGAL